MATSALTTHAMDVRTGHVAAGDWLGPPMSVYSYHSPGNWVKIGKKALQRGDLLVLEKLDLRFEGR